MGSFFTDILSFQHETAVFDVNPHQLRFVYNTYRFTTLEEIKDFEPELVINAVTVKYTLDAFHKVLPVLPKDCIISDIASVKTGLKKFYEESGFRYVSSHPMFGPTFASLSNLSSENAIIISEGDHLGKIFFKDLYQTLRLNIFEYTFEKFVVDLLLKMGYGKADFGSHATVASGDEGIDGIIMEDKLGFSLIYMQAKEWAVDKVVSQPDIQSIVGAIAGKKGEGLFVTTARFSQKAKNYAHTHHIILIDGERLANLMIEYNFCVSTRKTFEIKALDTDALAEYQDD